VHGWHGAEHVLVLRVNAVVEGEADESVESRKTSRLAGDGEVDILAVLEVIPRRSSWTGHVQDKAKGCREEYRHPKSE